MGSNSPPKVWRSAVSGGSGAVGPQTSGRLSGLGFYGSVAASSLPLDHALIDPKPWLLSLSLFCSVTSLGPRDWAS